MDLFLYVKGWLVVLLLHSSQAQDTALPSPSPESVLPSLAIVMDAVKAAFMEVVKISKDDAVRAVIEQVVEELGPQENIAGEPPATADNTEDRLPAVVHEHADNETTNLTKENAKQDQISPKLNSSEKRFGLPDQQELSQHAGLVQELNEKHVVLIYRPNNSAEESVQEVDAPVQDLYPDLMELTQDQNQSYELESEDIINQKHAEQDESQYWSFESRPEGVPEEQASVNETQDTDGVGEIRKIDERKNDMEVDMASKIQEEELLDLVEQTQPQDQAQFVKTDDATSVRIVVEEIQNEHEQEIVDNESVAKVKSDKESMEREAAAHNGKVVEGLLSVSKATEKTSHELESTTPKKDAWKIGVIAVAFLLILQTLVTVTYILKCKRKRRGTTADDPPEGSQILQETLAMTSIHTRSMAEKSRNH